ncbi:aminoglycoside phosphotransferase family protein [Legionella cardiaca]|uniref:Aminoglycoside 3'-phosphotransferase/choline kinase family protein n=1 Tax=Legionella cardiaca TaxID=1071983 RepID=A0ABY8ATB7_9GAMM|nr:aminoglycoside 3'-phosphotransferase/choline kinase family protein [Legionella cardiaca]WED43724.1 aminoglycoside 3'-phosphotransferase/choline kinase family protein [Legionella cardiaca]
MNTINCTLASVNSFEEFEELKLNHKIFEEVIKKILVHHNLPLKSLTLFSEGTNIVFSYDDSLVIKLFPPFHQDQFESERLVLKTLEGKLSVETPTLHYVGEIAGWPYIIMTQLKGVLLESLWHTLDHKNKLIIMKELGSLIREVHSLPTQGLEPIDCDWKTFLKNQVTGCIENHRIKNLSTQLLQQIPSYIEAIHESLLEIENPVILTGEYTPMNFLVTNIEGVWHISGLIDFGDAMLGHYKYDLLGPGAFLIQGDKELLKAFLSAYGFLPNEQNSNLSHQLTALMLLHKYSNLRIQVRINDWENTVSTLKELEDLVWGF